MTNGEWITVTQAAAMLELTPQTVKLELARGRLEGMVKDGKQYVAVDSCNRLREVLYR